MNHEISEAQRLDQALALLRAGQLVGMPTETVYGLAADARNAEAVRRIFALKGRPADHPLIVHLPSAEHLDAWACEIPDTARRLAEHFWPGALTLILRRAEHVLDVVTGGQATVGLRVPAHPVAIELLQRFGSGLAAPSANRYRHVSPTLPEHVHQDLGHSLFVLDGGACQLGIESTIIDCSAANPRLLRPGTIPIEAIEQVMQARLDMRVQPRLPTPGSDRVHYAPNLPCQLLSWEQIRANAGAGIDGALICHSPVSEAPGNHWVLQLPDQPVAYARALYAALRDAERSGARHLWIEQPPGEPQWAAVLDRLQKACAR